MWGDGILERVRSTSLALLGLTAAVGLGLIAFMGHQALPLLPGSPVPDLTIERGSIRDATIVASPAADRRRRAAADGRGNAVPSFASAPSGGSTARRPGSGLGSADGVAAPGSSSPKPVAQTPPPTTPPAPAPTNTAPAPTATEPAPSPNTGGDGQAGEQPGSGTGGAGGESPSPGKGAGNGKSMGNAKGAANGKGGGSAKGGPSAAASKPSAPKPKSAPKAKSVAPVVTPTAATIASSPEGPPAAATATPNGNGNGNGNGHAYGHERNGK